MIVDLHLKTRLDRALNSAGTASKITTMLCHMKDENEKQQ